MADDGAILTRGPAPGGNPLLSGPILPKLLRFALPNMGAMLAGSVAAVAETAYVGALGVPALAGMALVFPLIMLQMMLSGGAMGGGVSAAIARALGAGESHRANALAVHTMWIGIVIGGFTTVVMVTLAPWLLAAIGGRGEALDQAAAFAGVAFLGSIGVWLINLFASVLRGAGNMGVPSVTLLVMSVAQVAIGGALGLGLGPIPRLGMPGVAAGQVVAASCGALFLYFYLRSGRARVRLVSVPLHWSYFADILKVGGTACISPLQTVATIVILNRLVAGFGATALAGFGIGVRLEFLLTPISFAIGVASVPLVGAAIGAGMIARARRTAWIAAGVASAGLATIGVVLAIFPGLWAQMFTSDPETLATTSQYFRWVGPAYAFFGAGICLYFSSMPAGRVGGMVLAGTLRLAVVAIGGWFLVANNAPLWSVFALIAAALVAFGLAAVLAMARTSWGDERGEESTAGAPAAISAE